MDNQDWEPVILTKNKPVNEVKKPQSTLTKTQKALLNDEDAPPPKFIDRELSQQIIQARVAKGMNRKQLAQAMSISESIVADFENGKALHNGPMISKFKSYLGINKNTTK